MGFRRHIFVMPDASDSTLGSRSRKKITLLEDGLRYDPLEDLENQASGEMMRPWRDDADARSMNIPSVYHRVAVRSYDERVH